MTTRWVLLPVLLYLTLDFASPWVAGAFRFDPDESVEALKDPASTKRRGPIVSTSRGVIHAARVREVVVARPEGGEPLVGDWLVDLRRSHRPSSDPSPPSDDH